MEREMLYMTILKKAFCARYNCILQSVVLKKSEKICCFDKFK